MSSEDLVHLPPTIGPIATPLSSRHVQPTEAQRDEFAAEVRAGIAAWRSDYIGPAWYAGFAITERSTNSVTVGVGLANLRDETNAYAERALHTVQTVVAIDYSGDGIVGAYLSGGTVVVDRWNTVVLPLYVLPLYLVHNAAGVFTIRDLRFQPGKPRHRQKPGEWDVQRDENGPISDHRELLLLRGPIDPLEEGYGFEPYELTQFNTWHGAFDIGAAYVRSPGGVFVTVDFDIDKVEVDKSDMVEVALASNQRPMPPGLSQKERAELCLVQPMMPFLREKAVGRGTHAHFEWFFSVDGIIDFQGLIVRYLSGEFADKLYAGIIIWNPAVPIVSHLDAGFRVGIEGTDHFQREGVTLYDVVITMQPVPGRRRGWA